jgi:hypothetical protein
MTSQRAKKMPSRCAPAVATRSGSSDGSVAIRLGCGPGDDDGSKPRGLSCARLPLCSRRPLFAGFGATTLSGAESAQPVIVSILNQ